VVLTGPNGAGKTNLLEAVSLLAPGHGLRGSAYAEFARHEGPGDWAVAARLHGLQGEADIGTGLVTGELGGERAGRTVRIDGATARSSGALGAHAHAIWLTPAMDGLFTGPASERRRFLDRLVQSLEASHREPNARFERAMRQRNRLLETGERQDALFAGLEAQMAEAGVAVAASRLETVRRLAGRIAAGRAAATDDPFPWAELALAGALEAELEAAPAVEVEDAYRERLEETRERDRAAGRTLEGPHRSDMIVTHGPKQAPARTCSTGEQKALLVGLVLAHAELAAEARQGLAPLLLLDEIAAHLDAIRRRSLFAALVRLSAQAWMSGTDWKTFEILGDSTQFLAVDNGGVRG
jgi:DNA replication and repair protein RecF